MDSVNGGVISELYVVSDLHLGGQHPDHRLCTQSRLLAGLVRQVRTRCQDSPKGRVVLLFAGDIIDFLIPHDDPEGFQPPLRSVAEGRAIVRRVIRENPELLSALKDFLKEPNAELVFLLGNHDLELRFPAVWNELEGLLLDSQTKGRLLPLCNGDTGYKCSIGGSSVLCVHGNEVDGWNVVDYAQLSAVADQQRDAESLSPPRWEPNHGTRLVIHKMNRLKQSLNYPFVDLLKPERAVAVKILSLLEPELALASFPDLIAASIGAKVTAVLHGRRSGQGMLGSNSESGVPPLAHRESFLGTERQNGSSQKVQQTSAQLLEQAQRDHEAGLAPSSLVEEAEGQLGLPRYLTDRVLHLRTKPEAIRDAVRDWSQNDHSFVPSHRDEPYTKLMAWLGKRQQRRRFEFVIAGHTHLARAIENDDGSYYFNAGTWMQLIRLSPAHLAQEERFQKIYDDLFGEKAKRKTLSELAEHSDLIWNRPTVVRIRTTERGAEGELLLVKESGASQDQTPQVLLHSLQEWPFVVDTANSATGKR
jgi:UDP-2,3-diacylglucosamine pyrophosphatase LpxH